MGALRFLWAPGGAAAEGGKILPALAALGAASFAEGASLKFIFERAEFTPKAGPPTQAEVAAYGKDVKRVESAPEIRGTGWEVGASVVAVALVAWFVRSTAIELALDLRRVHRNMRATLRATAWLTAFAAAAGAAWGFAALAAVPQGAPPEIVYRAGESWTMAAVAPTVWTLTLPFAALWLWRAVWEGRAAAKLYGRPLLATLAASLAAGTGALVLSIVVVSTLTSQYDRILHAFGR